MKENPDYHDNCCKKISVGGIIIVQAQSIKLLINEYICKITWLAVLFTY